MVGGRFTITVLIFILGLVVGSFLNTCIYRLPQQQSIVYPGSHCLICGKRLGLRDMVPVISYILLKGRCRYCGQKISPRYAVVEALTGCLFVLCLVKFGFTIELIRALIFVSFLIVITFIDYDCQLILDRVLLWFAPIGAAVTLYIGDCSASDMLIGSLVCGGLLLLVAIVSRGGMGGGDIKFAAALGLWLGWKLAIFGLFLAFLLGGLSSAILLISHVKGRKDMIPFGPFIAGGAMVALLYGWDIIVWYLHLV